MSTDSTNTCPPATAQALFDAGRLDDAIRAQSETVKADPTDEQKRLFLVDDRAVPLPDWRTLTIA